MHHVLFGVALARPAVEAEVEDRQVPLTNRQLHYPPRRRLSPRKPLSHLRVALKFAPDALYGDEPELGMVKGVFERDRPMRLLNHSKRCVSNRPHPSGQLTDIGHRGAKTHEAYARRGEDDALLPHGTALRIVQIVYLVKYHIINIVQPPRIFKYQVTEYFRSHYKELRVLVDSHIPRLNAHGLVAEAPTEVAVFLVRQRLDGRCVHGALTLLNGLLDRILGDKRLPTTGRGGDYQRFTVVNGLDRGYLKRVEF